MPAMNATWNLPLPEGIGLLIRDLLGRQATSKKAPGPMPPGPRIVAAYVIDDGTLSGACAVDLQLAAHLGAAMTMVPVGVADDAVRAKHLDPLLLDNVREILNIGSRWLMPPKAPHVKLSDVYVGELPAPVADLLKAPPRSLHVEVTIHAYKGGRLSLVSL